MKEKFSPATNEEKSDDRLSRSLSGFVEVYDSIVARQNIRESNTKTLGDVLTDAICAGSISPEEARRIFVTNFRKNAIP